LKYNETVHRRFTYRLLEGLWFREREVLYSTLTEFSIPMKVGSLIEMCLKIPMVKFLQVNIRLMHLLFK